MKESTQQLQIATLAAGCFWCYEPIFKVIPGVESISVGYAGGHTENPTYKQIITGNTGHAEAFQIKFDPQIISFAELLEVFWQIHDPTTKDRQGNDIGNQYRSVIFYHSQAQKEIAIKSRDIVQRKFKAPIVTVIQRFDSFYPAEDYHQNFYERNKYHPYCQVIIKPKLRKYLNNQTNRE